MKNSKGKGHACQPREGLKKEAPLEGAPVHLHPGIKTCRAKQLKEI